MIPARRTPLVMNAAQRRKARAEVRELAANARYALVEHESSNAIAAVAHALADAVDRLADISEAQEAGRA